MQGMSKDLLVCLGDRIQRLRKKRGWTQVVMAEKIGLDRSFIADVERGKRNISKRIPSVESTQEFLGTSKKIYGAGCEIWADTYFGFVKKTETTIGK